MRFWLPLAAVSETKRIPVLLGGEVVECRMPQDELRISSAGGISASQLMWAVFHAGWRSCSGEGRSLFSGATPTISATFRTLSPGVCSEFRRLGNSAPAPPPGPLPTDTPL